LSEVDSWPSEMIWRAHAAMECIHADEVLEMLPVWNYSDIKKDSQKNIDKHYSRMSKKHRESELKTLTPEELAYGIAKDRINGK
jgi:hypothetical protein